MEPVHTGAPPEGQLDDLRSSLDAVGSDIHGRISELTGALERFERRQRDETSRQTTEVVRQLLADRDARLERVESAVTAAAGFIRRLKASITDALAARDNRLAEVQRAVTLAAQRLDTLAEGLEPLETDLDAQAEQLHQRTSVELSRALDERDQRIDAIVRAVHLLETRMHAYRADPALAALQESGVARDLRLEQLETALTTATARLDTTRERLEALERSAETAVDPTAAVAPALTALQEAGTARDQRVEQLEHALTAAVARLDALEQPPAEPGADEPPTDEEPAGADLEEELVRRDERIDARIDALVRAMKAIEERERTKSSENGKASDPSVVQRQIEAALAGRDAKLDQVEAALTAATARLEGLDKKLDAPARTGDDEGRVGDLQESIGSITSRLDRLAAAVTEALALRDAQLEEVLEAFNAAQARVEDSSVSGAAGRRASG